MTQENNTPAENTPAEPQCDCSNCGCGCEETAEPNFKPVIEFDDFLKLDLRVGTVVKCEEHPNADKLLVLQVDLGCETRQIIAGMKKYYAPEELQGKQVMVVCNLAPRKMRGLESQGMMIAASSDADKSLVVAMTPDKPVAAGASCS